MNPFLAFCLYVAARVFIQYLKFRPKDEQMISSLQFLLAAMHALKRKNPLTESFLVQLDVDLEGMGIDVGQRPLDQVRMAMAEMPPGAAMDSMKCSPMFEIRESQASNSKVNRFGGGAPTFDNNGMSKHGNLRNPDTENPGPPFHVARANLNLTDEQRSQSFDYLSGAESTQYNLPNRNRSGPTFGGTGRVNLADSLSPSASESSRSPNMNNDQQSTSTRSNSYKDSSSHASFTPPSLPDNSNSNTNNNNNNNNNNNENCQNSANNSNSPLTTTTSNSGSRVAEGNVFSMDSNFSNFQPGFLGQPIESSDGMFTPLGTGWEMSGIEITGSTGTGLTPGPWSDMLSGMGTGWSNGDNGGFIDSTNDRGSN
jgi:hypothetical protein